MVCEGLSSVELFSSSKAYISYLCTCCSLHTLHLSAADFGPWSSWADCMCDLKRYRSRVCESEPCVGDYVESEDCACVPLNAAGMLHLYPISF